MKKMIQFFIVVAVLGTPLVSQGKLVELPDYVLKQITGQAGIMIQIDDIVLEEYIGAIKFIDDDGYGENDAPGAALVIRDRHRVQEINAIIDGTMNSPGTGQHDIHHDYSEHFTVPSALTIDVGKCDILSYMMRDLKLNKVPQLLNQSGITDANGWVAAGYDRLFHISYDEAINTDETNVVGVVASLPTIEIHTSQNTMTIGVEDMAGAAFNHNRDFISINMGESSTAILGGRIEIAPK